MARPVGKRGNEMSDVALSAAVRSSLLALQRTTDLIDRTNNRLATGLRVAGPVDDPVAFFSSKALRDRAFDFTERKGGIDQGISTVTAALDGVESIDSLVRQLKGIATSLKSATSSQFTDLVSQFNNIRGQIGDLANDAQFQGINLIDNTTESLTINFANNTTSLLTIDAVNLRQSGLLVDAMEIRADSKVSFTGTVTSGVALNNTAAAVATGSLSNITAVSGFGGQFVVTYNGTGATLTSTGAEIVFSINTQYSITVAVGTGDDTIITQGQTLTLQLASFNAAVLSAATAVGGSAFSTGALVGVTGVFVGVISGLTGATVATGDTFILAANTAGAFQSGVDFIGAGVVADIDDIVVDLDAALGILRSQAQKLGSNVALLQTRLDFTEQYTNTLEEGADKLTLADLNEEGANLLALQTRQQLGISALAFAGQSEQGILSLFN
jgi:flagellin